MHRSCPMRPNSPAALRLRVIAQAPMRIASLKRLHSSESGPVESGRPLDGAKRPSWPWRRRIRISCQRHGEAGTKRRSRCSRRMGDRHRTCVTPLVHGACACSRPTIPVTQVQVRPSWAMSDGDEEATEGSNEHSSADSSGSSGRCRHSERPEHLAAMQAAATDATEEVGGLAERLECGIPQQHHSRATGL